MVSKVPVPKKDGKVRMCIDFRNLNKASQKDDFPLPHIDVLIDHTAGHEMLSMLDDFSGSDQDGRGGQGKDGVHHTLGNVLLRCHAPRL